MSSKTLFLPFDYQNLHFMYALTHLNWLHVFVATLAYFALGAIWYSFLFQKQWIRYQNIDTSNPDAKKGAGMIMLVGFIWTFIMVTGIAVLVSKTPLLGVILNPAP